MEGSQKIMNREAPEWCDKFCQMLIRWLSHHPLTLTYLAAVITSIAIVEGFR